MGQNYQPPQQPNQQPPPQYQPPQYQGPPPQYPPQYPQQYLPQQPTVIVQKRSACLPAALITCGVLVVLVVIAVGGLAFLGSQVNSTLSTSSGSNTTATAKIGDAVNVGSWKVTVEKMETSAGFDWSGFKNIQTPKGIYALVYVTASNVTNRTDSVNSFDYALVDASGAQFSTCTEFGCIAYPKQVQRDYFGTQVPPRTATKLLAIFDVAPHAKGMVLTIEGTAKIAIGNAP
jgi:hypothetical protein